MSNEESSWSEEQIIPLLGKVSLFEGLPDEDLGRVSGIVTGTSAEAGEVLFEEGDEGDSFFIVFSGAVEIVKRKPGGEEEKLAVRRAGEGFGEMALLNDAPRSATARVTEPTQLLRVERSHFRELLGGDTLAGRMMETLSRALRALDVRFAAQARALSPEDTGKDVGKLIQASILPRSVPKISGASVAAGTALSTTGDGRTVWLTLSLTGGRTGFGVLQIQGDTQGLPPAHHLAVVRALLMEAARTAHTPGEVLARVNEGLLAGAGPGGAVNVELALAVVGDGRVEWASAGTVGGAMVKRDGSLQEMPSHGPPLGVLPGFTYGVKSVELAAGDQVLVVSGATGGLLRGAADLVSQRKDRDVGEVVGLLHRAIQKAHDDEDYEVSAVLIRGS